MKKEFFRFSHPNDIVIGQGRIIYAPETFKYIGIHPAYHNHTFLEGWVLPGGIRTRDRARAEEAARAIDAMIVKQEKAREAAAKRVFK